MAVKMNVRTGTVDAAGGRAVSCCWFLVVKYLPRKEVNTTEKSGGEVPKSSGYSLGLHRFHEGGGGGAAACATVCHPYYFCLGLCPGEDTPASL